MTLSSCNLAQVIGLSFALAVSAHVEAAEPKRPVSVEVRELETVVWPGGKGHFRAINFWKEPRPKLLVESISNGRVIYSVDLKVVDVSGRRTDLSDEVLDAFIEKVALSESELAFRVEAYQAGGSFAADCCVKLDKHTPPAVPKCQRRGDPHVMLIVGIYGI